jgi:patatin-like phospholipase/acyl hydrolase
MPAKELVKVLSIDGGGIRGIVPALVLAEIENRTERPACELFDLIAGTSTGGIIALGVTAPVAVDEQDGGGRPRWSARELASMYESEGAKIFHRSLVRTLESVDGLLVEKYSASGLEAALEHYLGGARLSQALTDVLITSYDIYTHEPFFFKSFVPRARGTTPGQQGAADQPASTTPASPPRPLPPTPDYAMTMVARATSAAPTYFKPEDVPVSASLPSESNPDYVLVDGGTFANNPAMCAYAESRRNHPGADVLIVSLGTGRLTESISYKQARHWGLIQWAHPLLGVIMDGSSAAIDYQLDELLGRNRGHFRFQTVLEGASDSLDDARTSNIAGLRRLAEGLIESDTTQLDEVCALLS